MPSIQLYQYFVGTTNDGRTFHGGSLSQARTITLGDGEESTRTVKVGPETALKIFDASENAALTDFDFLWLETDLDVLIQFTTGVGVTDAYDVKELKGSGTAGEMGPAVTFGSDATQLLDGTIDTFDGTAGTIGEIWAYNEDDTNTATVRITIAT